MKPWGIVLDLETAPRPEIGDTHWPQWRDKHDKQDGDAALYPEFGFICVVGAILVDAQLNILRERAFFAANPAQEVPEILNLIGPALCDNPVIIGHNIKGFDIPFLAKRYLAHGLILPAALRVLGKKPWEIPHEDTYELLKFGGFSGPSLESAALLLGLPSPKAKCHGYDVPRMLEEGREEELTEYCLGDCRTTLEIYRTITNLAK